MFIRRLIAFVFLPILLASSAEFLLKATINSGTQVASFADLFRVFLNPRVDVSIALIVISGVLWLVGMSKFELSFMYPFLTINFVIIIFGSHFFLGEPLQIYKYFSIGFIAMGLWLISKSKYSVVKYDEEKGQLK